LKERKIPSFSANFDLRKALTLQTKLAKKVIKKDLLPKNLKHVAGIDVSYARTIAVAAVATLNYRTMDVVEKKASKVEQRFPYIPTLLSFREAPAIFSVLKKLKLRPDVYLVDAHGVAHPRRFGLACHIGVIKKIPTIGVAKSRLFGKVGNFRNNRAPVTDNEEVIATVLLKGRGKPLYVSLGHMVNLERAVDVVEHFIDEEIRTAIPIMVAHILATQEKNRFLGVLK
jgi:deoxyribonuclease V